MGGKKCKRNGGEDGGKVMVVNVVDFWELVVEGKMKFKVEKEKKEKRYGEEEEVVYVMKKQKKDKKKKNQIQGKVVGVEEESVNVIQIFVLERKKVVEVFSEEVFLVFKKQKKVKKDKV